MPPRFARSRVPTRSRLRVRGDASLSCPSLAGLYSRRRIDRVVADVGYREHEDHGHDQQDCHNKADDDCQDRQTPAGSPHKGLTHVLQPLLPNLNDSPSHPNVATDFRMDPPNSCGPMAYSIPAIPTKSRIAPTTSANSPLTPLTKSPLDGRPCLCNGGPRLSLYWETRSQAAAAAHREPPTDF